MQNKRVLLVMACLALLMAGLTGTVITATAPIQASQASFKTPEDAVTAYLEGVAQGDLSKILQACAINEMSENFKFDLYIDRLRAFLPFQAPAPSSYPFYVELNKAQLSAQITGQVRILAYSLLSSVKLDGMTVLMDIDQATAFMKAVDPKQLAGLAVNQIGLPSKSAMSSTRYQDNAAKLAHVYGADESTERVALFSFGQDYYYVGFSLLRYGDNWKISSQTSPLANVPSTGQAQKTTVQQFENMISN